MTRDACRWRTPRNPCFPAPDQLAVRLNSRRSRDRRPHRQMASLPRPAPARGAPDATSGAARLWTRWCRASRPESAVRPRVPSTIKPASSDEATSRITRHSPHPHVPSACERPSQPHEPAPHPPVRALSREQSLRPQAGRSDLPTGAFQDRCMSPREPLPADSRYAGRRHLFVESASLVAAIACFELFEPS